MNNSVTLPNSLGFKAGQFFKLLKFRLSALVVFSGAFGYLLAHPNEPTDWFRLTMFCIGSFMITGAANTINQIIEKDIDKLMKRTAMRPLPLGTIQVNEAIIFVAFLAIAGSAVLLTFTNVLATALALLSLVLYGFVYTPMKQKTSFCVLVGAFPGALPPLIGWAAMDGTLSIHAFIIFGIQFIWQFPHFWAVAWVAHNDYTNAGLKMLPSGGGQDVNTAFQIMIYTLFLIPLGLLPSQFGLTGFTSAVIATCCGVLFLMQTFYLMKECNNKAALMMMFGSFIYLPVVQIAYLADKIQ
jgi:protoheme IX farnesyltransferase